MTEQEVIDAIYSHVKHLNKRDVYVGIAKDPKSRLFVDHNVSEKNGTYIARDTGSEKSARKIEKIFLDSGYKGGDGGGDAQTTYVYAYKITSTTRE